MRILFANKFFYFKGGSEYIFFDTARYLEKKGHKVIFFSMKDPQNLSSEYEKYFVSNVNYERMDFKNIIQTSSKLLYSFEARTKIEKLIKEQKPDIVHLNNIYHQISPSILHSIKKYKLPVVMTLHDLKLACGSYLMSNRGKICEDCECRGKRFYYCFLNKCVKNSRAKSLLSTLEMYLHHKILKIYDLVDVFISPSNFLQSKLKQSRFKGETAYLPNFVRLEGFVPEYKWKDMSIVYFGRLAAEKGLYTLIDAIKSIKGVSLKIIGSGPLETDIRSKIDRERLKDVVLLGPKTGDDLKNEIKKAMFVVLPSIWYENNSRCVIEAFALGKPVIGSRLGGIPELVKDLETGLTFEPGNVEDLRMKIEYFINNPGKIIEMGKNARLFVEKKLNAETYYQGLMKIYNQAMNPRL